MFIGEKSAVIYGLCEECAANGDMDGLLDRVADRLTGKYRELYFSMVYGDPDCTEGWGPKTVH